MWLVHSLVFVACMAQTVLGSYVSEEDTCECVPLYRCATQVHIIDIRNTTGGCSHYLDTCCTQIKPLPPRTNPARAKPRNGGTITPRNPGTNNPSNSGTINSRNPGTNNPSNSGTINSRNTGTINQNEAETDDRHSTETDGQRNTVAESVQFRNSPGEWQVTSRPKPPSPSRIRHGCGQRNPDGAADYRIINNVDGQTQFAEWPWMVAVVSLVENLITNEKTVMEYQCGGSLIHPKVVLTAAHCVNSFKKRQRHLKVLLGEWDTQTENEDLPIQEKKVHELIIHEQFEMGTLVNDVALLILHGPAIVADNVDTVCLPQRGSLPRPGTKCFATGWGKDQYGKDGFYQVILKSIELPIVSNSACQNSLRTTRLSKFFKLHESFVCAGGQPGLDTCKGDGGGPLVCPVAGREGHYEQVGVVSWGIGCGEAGVPGVYADMTRFRSWVDAKMTDKGLEKSWYSWEDNDADEDVDVDEGPEYEAEGDLPARGTGK